MTILEVDTQDRAGGVQLTLRGELGLSTIEKVEQELSRVEADGHELIVLDLSGLTFLDSTGLRTIVTADQRARRAGRRVVVCRGPDTVHRVFTITRLDERLEMVEDADSI
ncbi:MAG: STAS domain-containing protein [Thermoleophilaceae bacterium]|nr:STAS domain-containing protein [Thermoleophilaceae bacterium]